MSPEKLIYNSMNFLFEGEHHVTELLESQTGEREYM